MDKKEFPVFNHAWASGVLAVDYDTPRTNLNFYFPRGNFEGLI